MATPRDKVLQACKVFLVPLARFLVKNGIGFREFSEISKAAFVDVVSRDYGIRGRQTNISRVAVLTGLTRKEVGRIRKDLAEESQRTTVPFGRPEKILDLWFSDGNYLDDSRLPLSIPIDGKAPSFQALVRQVGGDIPPGAMMKELLRAGSLVEDNGRLRVVSRNFIPEMTDPDAVLYAGEAIADLIKTVNHNLFRDEASAPLLERRAYVDNLDPTYVGQFNEVATQGAEQLLEGLNTWITERQSSVAGENKRGRRVGIGIYLFRNDAE